MEHEFKTFIRNVHGHRCAHQPEEHILVEYINEGFLVEFRRKLKIIFMVDSSHPRAREIFKSTYRMRMEEERHLEKYYYMIHPYSRFRIYWETIMMVVYYTLLMASPFLLTQEFTDMGTVSMKFTSDLICFIDILLFFATGYLDVKSQKIVLSPSKVCRRYALGHLIFDILATLPTHFYNNITQTNDTHLRMTRVLCAFRLARLPTAAGYLRDFLERKHFYSYYLKIMTLILNFVIIVIWSSVILYLHYIFFVAHKSEFPTTFFDRWQQLLQSFNTTLKRFMFTGTGHPSSHEIQAILFGFLYFVIGAVINYTIFAIIVQICTKHNSANNKYKDMMLQADEYAKYKEMPPALRNKVFQFIDFKFQKNIYDENLLLSTMSTSMKQEVLLSGTKNLLDKVDFFKDLPLNIILRIVENLKSVIFLPNDVIVQAGIVGNAMYFIYVGTVAIYTKAGKEICHLHEGSHFGEIALIINEPRIASVYAVEECELFRLSRRDFQKAIEPFPEVIDKIKSSALGRLKNTLRVMDDEEVENADPDNTQGEHSDPTDKRY